MEDPAAGMVRPDPVPDTIPLRTRISSLHAERDEAAAQWLQTTIEGLSEGLAEGTTTPLRLALARSRRKLGDTPLGLDEDECERHGLPRLLVAESWTWLDLGRAALLLAALEHMPRTEHVGLVELLLRTGELGEQASLLRALPLVPASERFVPIAVEACRTNATTVFAAIAIDNPLPAASFSTPSFNQMVLKAVFIGVPVRGIVGLERRASPELRRMALDYASEREAAGRSVPADIELIIRLCSSLSQ